MPVVVVLHFTDTYHHVLTIRSDSHSWAIQKRCTSWVNKSCFSQSCVYFQGFRHLLNLNWAKNKISLLFAESPDFFTCYSRFSFLRGWQVCYIISLTHNGNYILLWFLLVEPFQSLYRNLPGVSDKVSYKRLAWVHWLLFCLLPP